MCLSIAIARPDDVLAAGTYAGHDWVVTNNGRGYRCGYVKLEPGHPWYGKDYSDIHAEADVSIHGGLTFAEPDVHCGKGGGDDGYWIGFDCAHAFDSPDPTLPGYDARSDWYAAAGGNSPIPYVVRTQEYVEAECRGLCEQAAAVSG